MSTPDQDVVEEIGRALGVEYEDAEELKGAEKIESRDRNRWEYDPASAEDYKDRTKRKKTDLPRIDARPLTIVMTGSMFRISSSGHVR